MQSIRLGSQDGAYAAPTRRVGYDSSPSELAGVNSGLWHLEGTPDLYDYKENKQKKTNVREEKDPFDTEKTWYEPQFPEPSAKDRYTKVWKDLFGGGTAKVQSEDLGDVTTGDGWEIFLATGSETVNLSEKRDVGNGMTMPMMWIKDVSDTGSLRLPQHPLETGMQVLDHKVIEPKTLRVKGEVYRHFSKMVDVLLNKLRVDPSLKSSLTLKSPWKEYRDMQLKNFTSRVSTQKYDVYEYTLTVQEIFKADEMTILTQNPNMAGICAMGGSGGR